MGKDAWGRDEETHYKEWAEESARVWAAAFAAAFADFVGGEWEVFPTPAEEFVLP